MEVGPQLIAKENLGDPILCFAEAGDNLIVTGTAMGRVSVWDKRMGSSTADRVTQLTTCGEDAIVALSVVQGNIYATYGPLLARVWSISELSSEERRVETVKFRRNDNKAMRHATHVVHDGGVNVLILTECQGWSHLINLESQRDIKPPVPCETGAIPCQLVYAASTAVRDSDPDSSSNNTSCSASAADNKRLSLITCATHVTRGSTCCVPLRKDKVSCTIKVWDVLLGNEVMCINAQGAGHVRAFSSTVACCNGPDVDLYSLENGGKRIGTLFDRQNSDVCSVDGVSDGSVVNGYVSLCADKRVTFWNGDFAQTRVVKLDSVWTYYSDELAWVRAAADERVMLCVGSALYMVHRN
jgi:hypothetical protein